MSDYGVHLSEYGLHLHVTRSGLEVTSTRVQFSAPPADRRPGSGTRTREPRVRSRASGVGGPGWSRPLASGVGGPRLPRPVGGAPRSTTLLPVPTYEALRGPPTACGCGRSGHMWRHRVQRYILHTHTAIRAITGARTYPGLPRRPRGRGPTGVVRSEVYIRDSPRTRTDHVGAQRGAGSAPGVVPRRRPRPGTVRVHYTRGVRGPGRDYAAMSHDDYSVYAR